MTAVLVDSQGVGGSAMLTACCVALQLGVEAPILTSRPELMLFDTGVAGHHPTYIRYLLEYWCRNAGTRRLVVVVTAAFARAQADLLQAYRGTSVGFAVMSDEETKHIAESTLASLVRQAFAEWRLLYRYAKRLQPCRVVVLHCDRLINAPLAIQFPLPRPTSGIYFRPSFHYPVIGAAVETRSERLRSARQKTALRALSFHRSFHTLFSLDSLAVPYIRAVTGERLQTVALADPVPCPGIDPESRARFRSRFAIRDNQKVLLFFGSLSPRKGIEPAFEGIARLPHSERSRLVVLCVGRTASRTYAERLDYLSRGANHAVVRVLRIEDYVPEADTPYYFDLADVVMAPYQRHVGMSGILLRAAAASRPVLTSDYGLLGALTRTEQLGIAADTTSPTSIANALYQLLTGQPQFDARRARQFARANSVERFCRTILDPGQSAGPSATFNRTPNMNSQTGQD